MKRLTTIALAVAVAAAAVSPAAAQGIGRGGLMFGMMGGGCPMVGMMGQGMMGPGAWGQGPWGGWARGMMGTGPRLDALIDGRLAYLKGALGITEAQTAAWNGYADAVRTRIDGMQAARQAMIGALDEGTAIARMDARIASMETMLTAMKALKPATETLYAALSDDQKKLADDLIGLDCGAM
jgi:hypothetical protein